MKSGYVYIMTNRHNRVLYTGVTSDLIRRVYERQHGITGGFTHKYRVHKLVWYACYDDISDAIAREKQIKAGSRAAKIALIETVNHDWNDLHLDIASSFS